MHLSIRGYFACKQKRKSHIMITYVMEQL